MAYSQDGGSHIEKTQALETLHLSPLSMSAKMNAFITGNPSQSIKPTSPLLPENYTQKWMGHSHKGSLCVY